MNGEDYRAAANSLHAAEQNADPDLAVNYRSLAAAYLALARFRERIEQVDGRSRGASAARRWDRRYDR